MPGYTYHVKNVVCLNDGETISQVSIGYLSGSTFMVMKKGSTDNPYHTVEYHHEFICKETDRIQVEFYNCNQGDDVKVYINGYMRAM